MGYVQRYRHEAKEKNLPDWNRFYIAEIERTAEAILVYRNPHGSWKGGKWITSKNDFPELPLTFPTYEMAFSWLEQRLEFQTVPITTNGEIVIIGKTVYDVIAPMTLLGAPGGLPGYQIQERETGRVDWISAEYFPKMVQAELF